MLALQTGWTPSAISRLPNTFRQAAHWVLYLRAAIGDDGLPDTRVPSGASTEEKVEAARLSVQVDKMRKVLFPED